MAPLLLAILLLLLIAGIFLTVLGVRGKRINDHPVCRQCSFDLYGAYPEVVTCPECGAGLKRDGSIRNGARKKLPALAFFGILFTLTSFVPVGVVAYALLTGSDLNKFKPLGFLLWESRHASQQQSVKIASELMDRMLQKPALSASQIDSIIDASLARQEDLSQPWSEEWGDLVDRAKFDGVLKPAQEARYHQHAAVLELKTRPNTYPGAHLPAVIQLKESRVGSTTSLELPIYLKSALLGAASLKRIESPNDQGDLFSTAPLGSIAGNIFSNRNRRAFGGTSDDSTDGYLETFNVSGSKARGFASPQQSLLFEVPAATTAAGTQPLALALELRPAESQGFGSFIVINGRMSAPGKSSAKPVQMTLKTSIDVKPDSAAICTPISPSKETTDAIEKQLKPLQATIDAFTMYTPRSTEAVGPELVLKFDPKDSAQPIAYKVFARDPGNPSSEIELGSICSGTEPSTQANPFQSMMSSTFTISINGMTTTSSSNSSSGDHTVHAPAPDWLGSTVDIVMKPDPAAAEKSLDQDQFYNKELVFKDVPVSKTAPPSINDPFDSLFRRVQPKTAQPQKKRKGAF